MTDNHAQFADCDAPPRMRFGYADPPYIGQAKRLYGDHPDYAGEVNHEGLIRSLCVEFPQGWALSLSMKSLPTILPMCPSDVLVLSWVKPIAPPMGDHRHYSWEPVILRGGRRPQRHVKSHLVLSPPQFTFRETPAEHVIGEKPEGFCHWLFEAAGLLPGDELVDLFPGSGAVSRSWESYKTTGPATALWRTCQTCAASPHERCVSLKTGRPTAIHAARATCPTSPAVQEAHDD